MESWRQAGSFLPLGFPALSPYFTPNPARLFYITCLFPQREQHRDLCPDLGMGGRDGLREGDLKPRGCPLSSADSRHSSPAQDLPLRPTHAALDSGHCLRSPPGTLPHLAVWPWAHHESSLSLCFFLKNGCRGAMGGPMEITRVVGAWLKL